jgi:CHAT domain-containing protein
MRHYLSAVENGTEVFQDSAYIGMTTLLASSYVHSNQLHKADSLLFHSINFLLNSGKKSLLAYSLYVAYGGILCQLQNYVKASYYIEPALKFVEEQEGKEETYSVILSMLAVCHMNMDDLEKAQREIEESVAIIEQSTSKFSESNKIAIYQKAGAIYNELGTFDKAEYFTKKAYDLSLENDLYVSEFINAANNLAVIYTDAGRYSDALTVLHQMEKKPLSEIERSGVYNSIFLANYYLDNEEETVKYANLCSNSLKVISLELNASFPGMTTENIWDNNAMQLKVNMGVLDKFHHNSKALEMCYDNSLFIRSLTYDDMSRLRQISQTDSTIYNLLSEIRFLKSERFAGSHNVYKSLEEKEKLLRETLLAKNNNNPAIPTWRDVKQSLKHNECAIEFITYVGFSKSSSETKDLKYAALILTPEIDSPMFVELCTFNQLHNALLSALIEQEIGINGLYVKGQEHILYKLIWNKIDVYVKNAKSIYISPILDIQDVNWSYIPCPDGSYLNDKYDIRIVTSTAKICNQERARYSDAYIYGGIEYTKEKQNSNQMSYRSIVINELCDSTRNGFGYLRASGYEADQIANALQENRIKTNLIKGSDADEESFRKMDGNSPSIIHLSTHGFYLVGFDKYAEYFDKLLTYSIKDNSMLLSGLLLADANSTLRGSNKKTPLNDGIITAEEIAMLDLRNTELVVLSACETANGVNLQEGFGGLVRAFKNAGVKSVLASLWKVPDDATAKLMISFYKIFLSGTEMHLALKMAQKEVSKLYPDPYYWASFILLD